MRISRGKFCLVAISVIIGSIVVMSFVHSGHKPCITAVAARSGGHILPALTLLKRLKQHELEKDSLQLHFMTTQSELDNTIMKHHTIDKYLQLYLPARNEISAYSSINYPLFGIYCFVACVKSFLYLLHYWPTKIVSTGGYISLPVGLAAWLLHIPVDLYELNAVPGKASQVLSLLASRIYVCFPEAQAYFKKKAYITNYPVRFSAEHCIDKQEACRQLALIPHKKTVFIIGGSQGSQFINKLMSNIFINAQEFSQIQVIHQTGKHNVKQLRKMYKKHNIKAIVFDYRSDLACCYCAADIIISRAGAGSLAEIIFFNKRAFIIPLQTSDNSHQVNNAQSVQRQYAHLINLYDQSILEKDCHYFYQDLRQYLL